MEFLIYYSHLLIIMKIHKITVFICMFTVFATSTTIFADDSYGVELLNLEHNISPDQETITISVKATIPVDDFVTAKLINSDGQVAHKMWYKVNGDNVTTFALTFTDIDRLNLRGGYVIQVEYDGMIDEKRVTLN